MADSRRVRTEGSNGDRPQDTGHRISLFWRIAAVFVAVTIIWLVIQYVSRAAFGTGYDRDGHVVSGVLATVLTLPVVVLARRVLDRRPWAGLGLAPLRSGWQSFLIGSACYLLPAAAGLTAVVALGRVEITLETSLSELLLLVTSLMALVFLYEAFPEELVFRGYLYHNLAAAYSQRLAVAGQTVLFTLWAVTIGAAPTVERVVIFLAMAAVLGMIRAITGDVWACIGFHVAFQTVQQLFAGGWAGHAFAVTNPGTLEMIAFGIVPFALSIAVLEMFVQNDVDWGEPESTPFE
ncbi:CAAX amino terminal protease [Halostagnicola larsenii XH-48]|uniref:CAAX amino terminal protease n=1 Tax=Halostagnicola larsenii XH-48 TaxID=797299 RepID=W0JST8_9EURY|nr:CPBP family intramembrane glutamic endopeptidase [Halostagnicola larsenii]AHG00347.1 CAAX amino terminal protease [Halostagnicola larsenii XH-48]